MRRRVTQLALAALVPLLVAAVALPVLAASSWRTWGEATVSAPAPMVSVAGVVKKPKALRYKVRHSQDRRVEIEWEVSCDRGAGFRTRNGTIRLTPPARRSLPITMSDADECDIFINAMLAGARAGGGRLSITAQSKSR